ncbi:hypothetical protein ON010_g10757 [Phytophthora cinnamomi]|nr:hypothetical protein ON010_g10757 [Phytophthora cinnamomi]
MHRQISRLDNVRRVISLISNASDVQEHNSVMAVVKLLNTENKYASVGARVIPQLVDVARTGSDARKTCAARLLHGLSTQTRYRRRIEFYNGVIMLLTMLRHGDGRQKKKHAAGALSNLAMDSNVRVEIPAGGGIPPVVHCAGNKVWIADSGRIPPLILLLRNGNDAQREIAASVVWQLSTNIRNRAMIAAGGGIPALIALIWNENSAQKRKALGSLTSTSIDSDNKAVIAGAGGIPPVVRLKAAIAAACSIPLSVKVLRGESVSLKEKVVAMISLLSSSFDSKPLIAAAGGISPLVKLRTEQDPIGRRIEKVLSTFATVERGGSIALKEHTVDVAATAEEIPLTVSSEVTPLAVAFARDGTTYHRDKGLHATGTPVTQRQRGGDRCSWRHPRRANDAAGR